jgi:hypothetical protein
MEPVTVTTALAGVGKPLGEWAVSGTSGVIGNAMWAGVCRALPAGRAGEDAAKFDVTPPLAPPAGANDPFDCLGW